MLEEKFGVSLQIVLQKYKEQAQKAKDIAKKCR